MKSMVKETPISEVSSTILHVNNLQRSAEWYADILSIPLQSIEENMPFHVFDMDNGVNLMLDDHRNMQHEKKHPICMLRTQDIEQAYAYAQQNNIAVILEMQNPHPGLAYFNIEDTEGNAIMICYSNWVNPNPILPSNSDHPIKNHVNSIVIPVINLKQSTEWYSKLLGHTIKPDRQDGGPIYWFNMPNGTGILLDDNRNNQDLDTFPTLMLKTEKIHEAYQYMKDKGVEIVRDVQFNHYFMIKDIEGNTIMVCL